MILPSNSLILKTTLIGAILSSDLLTETLSLHLFHVIQKKNLNHL